MKPFTNKKGKEFLMIEVPIYAYNFQLKPHPIGSDDWLWYNRYTKIAKTGIPLPKGNYQIIGLAKDVSESQAAEIVDIINDDNYIVNGLFKDYNDSSTYMFSATESLSSLIKSLGLNNPLILEKVR